MLIKAGVDMKCKICRTRKATVQDRNSPTDRKKTLCGVCHGKRLLEDVISVLITGEKRKKC
jgi:hypothetical protein